MAINNFNIKFVENKKILEFGMKKFLLILRSSDCLNFKFLLLEEG